MVFPKSIGSADAWGEQLPASFFDRTPLEVAPDLIGRVLATEVEGRVTAGRIVETEAYLGSGDPGSHAATKGITARNAVMYGSPGSVYVYFTYGNHHMLNLVCEPEGVAGAVLIRALEPIAGIAVMRERRGREAIGALCSGPGKLAQALGVDLADNGSMLGTGKVRVYAGSRPPAADIVATGRIGLRMGHDLPYRFHLRQGDWVSRGRTGPAPARSRRPNTERNMR